MIVFAWSVWAAPPEGVDPDDYSRWESATHDAFQGPAGCWDLTGALRVDGALHSAGTAWVRGDTFRVSGAGTWQGRLIDGTWSSFEYIWADATEQRLDIPIYPVVGRIRPESVHNRTPSDSPPSVSAATDGSTEAINLFHTVVDSWEPAGHTTMSEWNEALGAVQLLQDIPLRSGNNPPVITVTAVFPGGQPFPTAIDAVFPPRVAVGDWPARVNLIDTRVHLRQLRVEDQVLPQAEGFKVTAGFMGFTMGYEQQISYTTASRCAIDAASTTP